MLRWIFVGLGSFALSFSCLATNAVATEYGAEQTLKRLELQGHESVLQYGGSQEQTQALALSLPQGQVLVVGQNLHSQANNVHASSVEAGEPVDRVLVEEALTKEYKQQSLLRALSNQLKPNGRMVLHLPDYKQGIVAKVLLDTWLDLEDFVQSSPKFMSHNAKQYHKMLSKSGLKVESGGWHVNVKEFGSAAELKSWLSDNWAYCQDMEYSEKVLFVSVFVDKYLKASDQKSDGPVQLEQCFMDIEAQKLV